MKGRAPQLNRLRIQRGKHSAKSIAHPQITQIFADPPAIARHERAGLRIRKSIEQAPVKPAKPFPSGKFNPGKIKTPKAFNGVGAASKEERGKRRDCYL